MKTVNYPPKLKLRFAIPGAWERTPEENDGTSKTLQGDAMSIEQIISLVTSGAMGIGRPNYAKNPSLSDFDTEAFGRMDFAEQKRFLDALRLRIDDVSHQVDQMAVQKLEASKASQTLPATEPVAIPQTGQK